VRRFRRAVAWLGLGIAGAALPGCGKEPVKAGPAAIEVNVNDPASVTRATYEALRGELRAIAERKPEDAERYRAFIRERLLNFDTVLINKAIANAPPKYRDAKLNKFKNDMIDMWGRTIAYYADGLQMDTLRVEAAPAGEVGAVVTHVSAEHGDRKIGLKLVLRAGDDGAWFPMQILHDRLDRRRDAAAARPPTGSAAPAGTVARTADAAVGEDDAPASAPADRTAAPADADARSPAPAESPSSAPADDASSDSP
jgi:hypothetical protein